MWSIVLFAGGMFLVSYARLVLCCWRGVISWFTKAYTQSTFDIGPVRLFRLDQTADHQELESTCREWIVRQHQLPTVKRGVGFDTEWSAFHPEPLIVALMQLSDGRETLVVQMISKDCLLPNSLVHLLQDPSVPKFGVGIEQDVKRLLRHVANQKEPLATEQLQHIAGVVELVVLHNAVNRRQMPGLARLCNNILNVTLVKPKKVTLSNWQREMLTPQQIAYAAADAFFSWKLGMIPVVATMTHNILPSPANHHHSEILSQALSLQCRNTLPPNKKDVCVACGKVGHCVPCRIITPALLSAMSIRIQARNIVHLCSRCSIQWRHECQARIRYLAKVAGIESLEARQGRFPKALSKAHALLQHSLGQITLPEDTLFECWRFVHANNANVTKETLAEFVASTQIKVSQRKVASEFHQELVMHFVHNRESAIAFTLNLRAHFIATLKPTNLPSDWNDPFC